MRLELFRQEFTINPSAHQSHLVYRVYVPENLSSLEIQFQYGPILETNEEAIRQAVVREGLSESLVQEDTSVRNLLTFSINDPHAFRGAHHFFSENQWIEMNTEQATEGFIPGYILEGYWEFIISCHGVFSEKVTGQINIIGVSERDLPHKEEVSPLKELSLDQFFKNRSRQDPKEHLQVKRMELHSHTIHSDASQTTEELVTQAEKEEIDWLAITDHNTVSALLEAERTNHFNKSINLLDGIEYTTFYGHFLVHGKREEITFDWTKLSKQNTHQFLEKLKGNDVYITIAHPFDGGNPFCTGCRWEYVLENLKYVDAIEVWNSTNPHQSLSNEDAFIKWTQLLKQGYEIAASSGRDWHRLYPDEAIAYTHIVVPENETKQDVLQSLKRGRTYISIRPQIDLKVNEFHILGDRVEDATGELTCSVSLNGLKGGDHFRIYSHQDLIFEKTFTGENQWKEEISLHNDGYSLLRVEVFNEEKERIAFTNPIYIHRTERG